MHGLVHGGDEGRDIGLPPLRDRCVPAVELILRVVEVRRGILSEIRVEVVVELHAIDRILREHLADRGDDEITHRRLRRIQVIVTVEEQHVPVAGRIPLLHDRARRHIRPLHLVAGHAVRVEPRMEAEAVPVRAVDHVLECVEAAVSREKLRCRKYGGRIIRIRVAVHMAENRIHAFLLDVGHHLIRRGLEARLIRRHVLPVEVGKPHTAEFAAVCARSTARGGTAACAGDIVPRRAARPRHASAHDARRICLCTTGPRDRSEHHHDAEHHGCQTFKIHASSYHRSPNMKKRRRRPCGVFVSCFTEVLPCTGSAQSLQRRYRLQPSLQLPHRGPHPA